MENKSIICFIRHGETDWNTKGLMQGRDDIPLNENGRNQAKNASACLKNALKKSNFKFDKIITSPLERASYTASAISTALEFDNLKYDDRLLERDFGVLSGGHYDRYSKAVLEDTDEKSIETVKSLLNRVNSLIKDTVKVGENVLLVTHGAVARIYARNAKKADVVSDIDIGMLGNCNMVVYSYDGENILLQGYNVKPMEFNGDLI
ncbi:MAG: histidine phosphatase family protein [Clostridia bacterium]|nr:histidine phosphatase family protein [Clostridia bacterium]